MYFVKSFDSITAIFNLGCDVSGEYFDFSIHPEKEEVVPVCEDARELLSLEDGKPYGKPTLRRDLFEIVAEWAANHEIKPVWHSEDGLNLEIYSSFLSEGFYVTLDLKTQTAKPVDTDAELCFRALKSVGINPEEYLWDTSIEYFKGNDLAGLPRPIVGTDTTSAINSGLETALSDWLRRQASDLSRSYYLWARKARRGELVAMPIIAEDKPGSDWFLVTPERLSIGWTVQTAFTRLRPMLGRCPICNPYM